MIPGQTINNTWDKFSSITINWSGFYIDRESTPEPEIFFQEALRMPANLVIDQIIEEGGEVE